MADTSHIRTKTSIFEVLVPSQIKWIQNYKHDFNGCTLVLALFRYYCYSVSIKNVIVVLREEHVSKNFRKAARSAPFCHEKSKKALIPCSESGKRPRISDKVL